MFRENSSLSQLVDTEGIDLEGILEKRGLEEQDRVGRTIIHYAVAKNKEELFEALLKKEVDINATDNNRDTPLYIALVCRHFKLAERLLAQEEINVNVVNRLQKTPLLFVVETMCYKVNLIEKLLKRGADPTLPHWKLSSLSYAAKQDEVSIFRKLLDKSNKKDLKDKTSGHGSRLLHYMAESLNPIAIRILLATRGIDIDINAETDEGKTALFLAFEAINEENLEKGLAVVKELLDRGASPNQPDNQGVMPLHLAAEKGDGKLFERLLANAKDLNNIRSNDGRTLFHFSASALNLGAIKKLTQKGMDVNGVTQGGETPLLLAIKKIDRKNLKLGVEVINALLAQGADPSQSDHQGRTPLYRARESGCKEVVEVLFKALLAGIQDNNINIKGIGGFTLLHYATEDFNLGNMEIVLAQDGIEVDAETDEGKTALYLAVEAMHSENSEKAETAINQLLASGASPDKADNQGITPLHLAAEKVSGKLFEVLLAHTKNIDINMRDAQGWTLLHNAAFYGRLDIITLLLAQGIDVDAVTQRAETALYVATQNIDDECFDLMLQVIAQLLAYRADPNTPAADDTRPLHNAIEPAAVLRADIIEKLLDHGAYLNVKDNTGQSLLQYAAKSERADIVNVLLSKGADVGGYELQYALLKVCDDIDREEIPIYIAHLLVAGLDASQCIKKMEDQWLRGALQNISDKVAASVRSKFDVKGSEIPNILRVLKEGVKLLEDRQDLLIKGQAAVTVLAKRYEISEVEMVEILRILDANYEKWVEFEKERFSILALPPAEANALPKPRF